MSLYFLFLAWVLRDISAYHIRLSISWVQLPKLLKVRLKSTCRFLGIFLSLIKHLFPYHGCTYFLLSNHWPSQDCIKYLGLWRRQPRWLKVTSQLYSGFLRQRDVWGQFFFSSSWDGKAASCDQEHVPSLGRMYYNFLCGPGSPGPKSWHCQYPINSWPLHSPCWHVCPVEMKNAIIKQIGPCYHLKVNCPPKLVCLSTWSPDVPLAGHVV